MKTFYFSVTRGKKQNTLLFKHDNLKYNEFFFKENNEDSLAKCYNKAIDFSIQENVENIVLCHDDVIIESDIESKIDEVMDRFDVAGVAGATQCTLQEPVLWHIMGGQENLHGAVAHINNDKKYMTSFGPYPHRTILLDGVLMIINRKAFEKVRFDETCPSKWHMYDLDYSFACYKNNLRVGVSDIMITHASPGLKEVTQEFKDGSKWFLDKWKTKNIKSE
jgi:GT2 family glycosyltransferase